MAYAPTVPNTTRANQLLEIPEEPCDVDGCDTNATHAIYCPCGSGRECICAWCLTFAQLGEGQNVTFNHSCGHTQTIGACEVLPLGT